MKEHKASKIVYFLIFIQSLSLASSVTVKDGDTLSEIVEESEEKRGTLYGPEGRLKKAIIRNPEIQNPDLIYPGQTILLDPDLSQKEIADSPKEETPRLEGPILIEHKSSSLPSRWKVNAGLEFSHLILDVEDRRTLGKGLQRAVLSPSLWGNADYQWRETYFFRLGVKLTWIQWSEASHRKVAGREEWNPELKVGLGSKRYANTWVLDGGARPVVFNHSINPTLVQMDQIWLPFVGLELRHQPEGKLYWIEPRVEVLFSGHAPAGYQVETGFSGGVRAGYGFKTISFLNSPEMYVGYKIENQDSTFVTRTQHQWTLGFYIKIK